MIYAFSIFRQIITLICISLLGFGAKKYVLRETVIEGTLSSLIVHVTAPILTISTMLSSTFSYNDIVQGVITYFLSFAFLFVINLLAKSMERWKLIYKLNYQFLNFQLLFGNVVFIAFPILSLLYGEKGIINAFFFVMANDTFLWTYGVTQIDNNSGTIKTRLKNIFNENSMALLLGCIFVFSNAYEKLNNFFLFQMFVESIKPIGDTTFPLAMLFIGMMIAKMQIKFNGRMLINSIMFSLVKLVIIPLLILAVLNQIPFLERSIIETIVIEFSMPVGTTICLLLADKNYSLDEAIRNILVSTILCVFTIPIIVLILSA